MKKVILAMIVCLFASMALAENWQATDPDTVENGVHYTEFVDLDSLTAKSTDTMQSFWYKSHLVKPDNTTADVLFYFTIDFKNHKSSIERAFVENPDGSKTELPKYYHPMRPFREDEADYRVANYVAKILIDRIQVETADMDRQYAAFQKINKAQIRRQNAANSMAVLGAFARGMSMNPYYYQQKPLIPRQIYCNSSSFGSTTATNCY